MEATDPQAITEALRQYHADEATLPDTAAALRRHDAAVAEWLRTAAAGFFTGLWRGPRRHWPEYTEYAQHFFNDHPDALAAAYEEGRTTAEETCPELKKFEFEGVLGHGLSGEVRRARVIEDAGKVAVKLTGLTGPIFPARFESMVIADLDDPQVVRHKYTFVTNTGRRGLVMKRHDDPTLAEALGRNRTGFGGRAGGIVRSLLAVVGRVHARGYLHNDLKPGNLFLTPDDAVVVIDFGSASDVTAATCDQPSTRYYRAPERYHRRSGIASDLFSCGCVAFEVLTGRRCMLVDEPDRFALNEAELANVPAPYQAALRKALSAGPTARYQRAEDFLKDLAVEPPPGDNFVPGVEVPAAAAAGPGRILVGDQVRMTHWGDGVIAPLAGHDRLLARVREWLTDPASEPGPTSLKVPLFWIGGPSGLGKSMALQAVLGRLAAERDRTPGFEKTVVYLGNAVQDWPRWLTWCKDRSGPGRVVLAFDDDHLAARVAGYRAALAGLNEDLENGRTGWLPRVIACGLNTNREAIENHCHDVLHVTPYEMTQTDFDDRDRATLDGWMVRRTGRTVTAPRQTAPVLLAYEYRTGESAEGYVDRVKARVAADAVLRGHVLDVLLLNRLGLGYPTAASDGWADDHVRQFRDVLSDGGLFAEEPDPFARRDVYRFKLQPMLDQFLKKMPEWPNRLAGAVGLWVRLTPDPAAAAAGPDALARCVSRRDAVWSKDGIEPAVDAQLKKAYERSPFGLTDGYDLPPEYLPAWVRIQASRPGLTLAPAPLELAVARLTAARGQGGAAVEAVVQALLAAYHEFAHQGDREAVVAAVRDYYALSPDDAAWRTGVLDLLTRTNDPALFHDLCAACRTNPRGLSDRGSRQLRWGLLAWAAENGTGDRAVAADMWYLGVEWLKSAREGEHDWGHVWPALWAVVNRWFPDDVPTVRDAGLRWLEKVNRTNPEHAGIGYVWPLLWQEARAAEPAPAAALDRLADVAGQCLKRMSAAAPAVGYIWPPLWDFYGKAGAPGFHPGRRDDLLGFADDWLTDCLPTHGGIGHIWHRVWDVQRPDRQAALVQIGDEFVRNRPCDDEPMIQVWERLWDADRGRGLLLDKAREFLARPRPDHKDWSHVFERVCRWVVRTMRDDREADREQLQRVAAEWLDAVRPGHQRRKDWPHVFRFAWWHAGTHIPRAVVALAEGWLRDEPATNELYGAVLATLCDDRDYRPADLVREKGIDWLAAAPPERAYWGPVWLCVKDRIRGTAPLADRVQSWLRAFAPSQAERRWRHPDWPRVWLRLFDGKPLPVIPAEFQDLAQDWLRADAVDDRFHNAWPRVWERLFWGHSAVIPVVPAEFVALADRWVRTFAPPHRNRDDLALWFRLWEGVLEGTPPADRRALIDLRLVTLGDFNHLNQNWQFLWLRLWQACVSGAERDELRQAAREWLANPQVKSDRKAYGAVLAELVWESPAEFHARGVAFVREPPKESDSVGLVAAAVLAFDVPDGVAAATAAAEEFVATEPEGGRSRVVPADVRQSLDADTGPVAWQLRLAADYWERGKKTERNAARILDALGRAAVGPPLAAVAAALRQVTQPAG